MIAILSSLNNQHLTFDNIISSYIVSTESIDSLNISILLPSLPVDNFASIKLFHDNQLLFDGSVDEQIISKSADGCHLNILARSRASILFDNHAKPQVYYSVSLNDIFKNHISTYGFSINQLSNIDPCISIPSFTIGHGMSEYAVLKSFCLQALRCTPLVLPDNSIHFSPDPLPSGITISNQSNIHHNYLKSLFPFTSISYSHKRKNLISDLFFYNKDLSQFSSVSNPIAKHNLVTAKRYLSSDSPIAPTISHPVFTSNNHVDSVTLTSPFLIPVRAGQSISILDDTIPLNVSSFVVSEISFSFSSESIYSKITARSV